MLASLVIVDRVPDGVNGRLAVSAGVVVVWLVWTAVHVSTLSVGQRGECNDG